MEIFVRDEGKSLRLEVRPSDTIEHVKFKLYEEWNIPVHAQRLIYGGKQLESTRTLSESNILDGSSLELLRPVRAKSSSLELLRPIRARSSFERGAWMEISVYFKGTSFKIFVSGDMFVWRLRDMLELEYHIDKLDLRVLFRKMVVLWSDNDSTLKELGLSDGSVLEVEQLTTGPYVILAKLLNGPTVPIYVIHTDSIKIVKEILERRNFGVRSEDQVISFQGTVLENHQILGECRLDPNTVITVSLASKESQKAALGLNSLPHETITKDGVHEMHPHADMTDGLSTSNWEFIRAQLPAFMKWDVEYKASCWTFTPSSDVLPHDVPLTIAGAPVVVPVDYRYPIMGAVAPPPDPHPRRIDPRAPLNIDTIAMIFKEFPDAIGFYLLINGLLQIVVSEDFDFEWASSYRPNEFGHLKICYIRQSMDTTAGQVPISQQSIITSKPSGKSRQSRSPFLFWSQEKSKIIPSSTLKLEHAIEARVKESSVKIKHTGRIGVKTLCNNKTYLTISSHIIINALLLRKSESIFRKWRSNPQMSEGWIDKVTILAHGVKLGYISRTFDPDAKDYPNGFIYDVSLVSPYDEKDLQNVKSPVPNLGWLSDTGWNNLRRKSVNLKVLEDENTQAKTIPSHTPSECLVVGEGIFLNRNKLFASQKETLLRQGMKNQEELQIWKSLISRSLLYRVAPDFAVPGGQSGLALYTDGEREDATTGPGVVGFQSFVQRSGHVQTYGMEGRDLESRLRKGLVAFYGAFRVPEIMRKEHTIL